jgi:hypothetical protein
MLGASCMQLCSMPARMWWTKPMQQVALSDPFQVQKPPLMHLMEKQTACSSILQRALQLVLIRKLKAMQFPAIPSLLAVNMSLELCKLLEYVQVLM